MWRQWGNDRYGGSEACNVKSHSHLIWFVYIWHETVKFGLDFSFWFGICSYLDWNAVIFGLKFLLCYIWSDLVTIGLQNLYNINIDLFHWVWTLNRNLNLLKNFKYFSTRKEPPVLLFSSPSTHREACETSLKLKCEHV